jgi:hypothetical protein
MSRNPHKGTDFYDYLKEEGISKEVHARMEKEFGHLMRKEKSGLPEVITPGILFDALEEAENRRASWLEPGKGEETGP